MSASVPLHVLERAVPFLVVVDRNGHVEHVSMLMRQLCPRVRVGAEAGEVLRVGAGDQALLAGGNLGPLVGRAVTMAVTDHDLRFRAEVVESDGSWVFLATPLFTSRRQLDAHGLRLSDFPPSHPLREYLTLLSSLRGTLRDTQDLTDRLAAQQASLEQARSTAEQANAAKTEFLAHTSHELRTPMNGVLGMLDACLRTPELPPVLTERLAIAQGAAVDLLDLLDDLLDLAKVEAGQLRLEPEPFVVVDLLNGVRDVVSPKASVPVRVHVEEGVPRVLIADHKRLKQVLLNLAGNAVRFTDSGSVVLTARAGGGSSRRAQITLAIADTGPGIPEHARTSLFNAFQQVEGSTVSNRGGTGLGLTISRQLVQAMGGTIEVKSEVGRGSTFLVHLSLDIGSAFEASPAAPVPDRLHGHVLIAEDNPVNQLVARLSVEGLGLTCDVVDDGLQAIEAVETGRFNLVLMDVRMPVLNGLDATARIKERYPTLAVVGLTAGTLAEELAACRRAGMNDVVPKPFERELLSAVLSRWLTVGPGVGGATKVVPTSPDETVRAAGR